MLHRLVEPDAKIVALPPEVLAQLQRIEDRLTAIEKTIHRCPDCGEVDCPYENCVIREVESDGG